MSSLTELQDLIQKKYGLSGDALDPDKTMIEAGLDSLAIAEFLFDVEDHFAVTLPDDDPDVDTLRKLADLVDRAKVIKAEKADKAGAAHAAEAPGTAAAADSTEDATKATTAGVDAR